MDVQLAMVATLVDELVAGGVRRAVVSPGSRSTPVALALDNHPGLAVTVRLDERSAGFIALGMALAGRSPVVVATTSGTAAAELVPAVAEAHYARVPLVVITADRPPELQDVGAPQTMNQSGLFANFVGHSATLGPSDWSVPGSWRSVASRLVIEAAQGSLGPGPVHLNLMLREPLISPGFEAELERVPRAVRPRHRLVFSAATSLANPVAELLSRPRRGLIVAGAGSGPAHQVARLSARLGWPVLADPRSGSLTGGANVIPGADLVVAGVLSDPQALIELSPEVVLRLGEPPAAKAVNSFCDGLDPAHVVVLVDPSRTWRDPGRRVDLTVAMDPSEFLAAAQAVATGASANEPWLSAWRRVGQLVGDRVTQALAEDGSLSEPMIGRLIYGRWVGTGQIVVSSSMPIRELESFALGRDDPPLVLANRGVNGIDGVASTAVGVALASDEPTVAVVGDLAALHDLGTIAYAATLPIDLALVIVDNQGGGIFSLLSQRETVDEARFERLFGTPQGTDLVSAARAFGATVIEPRNEQEFGLALSEPVSGLKVIVVRTDRELNRRLHQKLRQEAAQVVADWARERVAHPGGR
jgi:2-succinyl-5-enolpyruvyl-6-hydroxy-3-cyclohexene-1-carboxylate synthase